MKISLGALRFLNKHYNSAGDPAPQGVDALVQKIGAQLGAVEEVIPFGQKYEGVIIAQVVGCADHPDADRLHVCLLDDGGVAKDVERNEQGLVQVVCGAPNVREGLLVAWLPPGSTVPSTAATDPFVLEARELRGVVSNGMLASPKELALSDNHDGILEIDGDFQPGTYFADAYHLTDDVVIDMENKMFTHRPDCFGWLGIAREIEGIHARPYRSPEWYRLDPAFPEVEVDALRLEVKNELPELVPRFTALTMRDVQVGPSPVWLQADLARAGLRSINNIVDYTNFYMLLTGQPLHAYDYDKVMAQDKDADHATLVVRLPRPGEQLELLNGKKVEPRAEAIMIATRDRLIGIGGVMGGADTEVDEQTRNIILECGTFDMYSVRRTSMTHGLFTDAVTRFNKGQSPLQNLAVLWKIADQIRKAAGGKIAGPVIDINHLPDEVQERGSVHTPVVVERGFINSRLGLDLSTEVMRSLLVNVEFDVQVADEELTVKAPFWRTDIESKEDVVEEVGRLHGFDQLPLELPQRSLEPAVRDPLFVLKQQVREVLSSGGANEVLSYSFVHGNLLDKVGQDRDQAFGLSNALSPDLQYFRLSLTPSLLERVPTNSKAGYETFALFEQGKTHTKRHADDDAGVPREFSKLALVYTASDKNARPGAAFYEARKFMDFLASELGLTLDYLPMTEAANDPALQPYDPARSAQVVIAGSGIVLGVVGEFRLAVQRNLKLPRYTSGFEIDLGQLLQVTDQANRYTALPRFPKVEQDMSLKVPASLPYRELFGFVWQQLNEATGEQTTFALGPLDIYQPPADSDHKHISFRIAIASFERTMTAEEVNRLLDTVAAAAHQSYQAERL